MDIFKTPMCNISKVGGFLSVKIGILLIKVFLLGVANTCKIKFRVSPQYVAVTEWLKVTDSKSVESNLHEGSNPSRYAMLFLELFIRVLK